jgi:hypothetical protein
VLLHPRSQLQAGRFTDALSAFHAIGDRLLNDHILFDVIPDDIATPERLASYRRVFTISSANEMTDYEGLSRFEAPETVRVSANRPREGDEIDIHFVNYARKEPAEKEKTGFIADESPTPVAGIRADLVVPEGFRVSKVEMITPEASDPQDLPIEQQAGRVRFTVPELLVYGVARVYLERGALTEAQEQQRAVFLAPAARAAMGMPVPSATTTLVQDLESPGVADHCGPPARRDLTADSHKSTAGRPTDNYSEDIAAAQSPRECH